jgi:hypothetical protein
MQFTTEGKIGIALALVGPAGAGAIMRAPDHIEIGWALVAIAVIGGILLSAHHFSGRRAMWVIRAAAPPMPKLSKRTTCFGIVLRELVDGRACGWPLADEPLRPIGASPAPQPAATPITRRCVMPPSLGVVEGGEIPYKPEALARRKQNQQDWLNLDPEIKCYLPGVPRATYMPYPFQILQSASAFIFVYEYAGAVRNIFLNDPGPAPAESWMGKSVGRWEGDTLVIDVTDLNDQTWFDRAGNFHSDKLHVVERYARTSLDVMSFEATIEDPIVFTRPWKISMPLYRRQEKNAQLLDFKCVEFVEELLYVMFAEEAWDMSTRFIS